MTIRRILGPVLLTLIGTAAPVLHVAQAQGTPARSPLSLAISPSVPVSGGTTVVFRVHTAARTQVGVTVRYQNGRTERISGRTGKRGRVLLHYRVPLHAYLGTVTVTARARVGGHDVSARLTFQLPYTIYISSAAVLHRQGTEWVPTTHIHVGEDVRFRADITWEEEAGLYLPPDGFSGGTVRVVRNGATLYDSPLKGGGPQTVYVYVDTRFADSSLEGDLQAILAFGHDTKTLDFSLEP